MTIRYQHNQAINLKMMTLVAYIVLLTYLLLAPPAEKDNAIWQIWFSNFCHIPAFGLLTYLIWRLQWGRAGGMLLAVCSAFAYGVLMEYVQGFTGREPSVLDVLLNTCGIIGVLVIKDKLKIGANRRGGS